MGEIQALWRRDASSGCVGGDCDTVFPRQSYRGRAGHPVILEVIPAAERGGFAHQPAGHEELVFIPDDVRGHLG
jgi:hypothetical protein